MNRVLFISPHLDDVAFSCSGTLVAREKKGYEIFLCTIFTGNVERPAGFALKCQTEKGIPETADYMSLRKEEDQKYASFNNIKNLLRFDFLEAPNRGYNNKEELFSAITPADLGQLKNKITSKLSKLFIKGNFNEIFIPASNGRHVDHRLAKYAALSGIRALTKNTEVFFYEELPYAMKWNSTDWAPKKGWEETTEDISDYLSKKIIGCFFYESQIEFQFGGRTSLATMITKYALRQGKTRGLIGAYEVLWRLRL